MRAGSGDDRRRPRVEWRGALPSGHDVTTGGLAEAG
jgi:hypothetical protein